MIAQQTFKRTTFTINRALEFFSEKELTMQIGHSRPMWPIALVKELIDTALNACEVEGKYAPNIVITILWQCDAQRQDPHAQERARGAYHLAQSPRLH